VAEKLRSFGWDTAEIDGNAMDQIVDALHAARVCNGCPKAIVLRTKPGCGIPTLERRERAHFVRVEPHEWDLFEKELEMTP
jgi:transketolase